MKHFIILICFILLISTNNVFGQSDFHKKLFPITENGKYGYIDENGTIVIKPQFSTAASFHHGLASVSTDQKFGYINEKGEIIVKPQYDEAGDFTEGLAVVSKDYRWGYLDSSGKEVIPLQFIEARDFSEGLAAVYIQSVVAGQDSQWGYINKKGEVAIAPKFYKAFDFHGGVAKVLDGKFGEANLQGFIDQTGNYVIKPQFALAGEFSEGLIPVEIGGEFKKTGERSYSHLAGKWGYIDKTGKIVIKPQFDSADEFSEGLANITIKEKYGYIDKTGKIVIKPQFDYSSDSYRCANFKEGRACFEQDEKIGFIDRKGNIVIEPQFTRVAGFSNGYAEVDFGVLADSVNERFPIRDNQGVIDQTGKIIWKPENKNRKIVRESKPADPKEYEGWQKIEEGWFSFYAPKEFKGGKRRGIDSTVYGYESENVRIGLDIGRYQIAIPLGSEEAKLRRKAITVDGQEGSVWHFEDAKDESEKYLSMVRLTFGEDNNKTYFSMFIGSKNTKTEELAEKIFSSLRFKLNLNHKPN